MSGESPAYRELARLAVQVALEAPLRRRRFRTTAYIPWDTVEAIRAECEREGIDWRKAKGTPS